MVDPQKYDLELRIAQGENVGSEELSNIADAAPLTCPDCGGVLSQLREAAPLRFRCQVGHAINGEQLLIDQGEPLHGAMTTALRLVNEHVDLLSRLAADWKWSPAHYDLLDPPRQRFFRTPFPPWPSTRRARLSPIGTGKASGTHL